MSVDAVAAVSAEPPERRVALIRRRRGHTRRPYVSGLILVLFALGGSIGPLVSPHDPNGVDLSRTLRPPLLFGGSWSFPLGTDQLGRDILSRLLTGARVSLLVALTVVVLAGAIGVLVGVIAGYYGGRVDAALMRLTDAMISFPFLLVAIVFVAIFGAGLVNVIIVLALAGWAQYARVLRSEVLRIKTQDFITMAYVMGAGGRWIMTRHVVPNFAASFLVLATLQIGLAIIAEGSLSFLGIGVRAPNASWGNMLADGRNFISTSWWLPVVPGVALSLTVLAANIMGDWLRVSLDPATRR